MAFLSEFGVTEISQRLLTEALERHAPPSRKSAMGSSFLSGGYYAIPGSLRETTEFTIPAVLDKDLDRLLCLQRERKPFDGLIVPVPRRDALDTDERPASLPAHLAVASSALYSPTRGFGFEGEG